METEFDLISLNNKETTIFVIFLCWFDGNYLVYHESARRDKIISSGNFPARILWVPLKVLNFLLQICDEENVEHEENYTMKFHNTRVVCNRLVIRWDSEALYSKLLFIMRLQWKSLLNLFPFGFSSRFPSTLLSIAIRVSLMFARLRGWLKFNLILS